MKISDILESPCVKILSFLDEEDEIRFSDFTDIISSRGTLSENLNDLEEENLIQRRVVDSKPIKSYYSLTKKGKRVAQRLEDLNQIL